MILQTLRFIWTATKGCRIRPWRSPYLRWRMETYSGQPADTVRARDIWRLVWIERRQVLRYARWLGAMRRLALGVKI